jgi:hypothetical protein
MKKQVIVIHGGDSFATYEEYVKFLKDFPVTIDSFRPGSDWKGSLQEKLGPDYDVLMPRMPNKSNARFAEWAIWFEKTFPFLEDGAALVGHSLGGMFLAKYLAERDFPKKIGALFLVAAPHNKSGEVGDFTLPASLERVSRQAPNITLFYSRDDRTVPFSESEAYKAQLPDAELIAFDDRGHFTQHEFPELVDLISRL